MYRYCLLAAMAFLACLTSWSHPGGLDSNGGHTNHKTGMYHVHRPLTPAPDGTYWLNTGTGVRHRVGCRYFGSSNAGRFCLPSEGRPCGVCGG